MTNIALFGIRPDFSRYLRVAVGACALLVAACGGGGYGGGSGSGTPMGGYTPAISVQPKSVSVAAGSTATFSVVATGYAPLSYQWMKNSTMITGATMASYTTPATVTGDSGTSYAVVVSNSYGNITSSPAILTVM